MREIKFDFVSKHDDGVSFIHEVYTLDEIMYTLPEYVYDGHPKKLFTIIAKRQYTGLKDKNGVEIYEGDIVKLDDVFGAIAKIVFLQGSFMCEWLNDDCYSEEMSRVIWTRRPYTGEADTFEVIGNIYENPELLETK